MTIIDTHIHLFDPARPQGVPWPAKDNPVLYRAALPDRFRKLAVPLGVTGAIEVECSPWLEDNQWVLDVAARDRIMLGMIGNLEPGKKEFRAQLDRFSRNPLFRGIRYGNLWGRDLGAEVEKQEFIADLKAVAEGGLVLDSANPDPRLLGALVKLTDRLPGLRVVIDHLPRFEPPADPAARRDVEASLAELAKRPQVYVKVSGVLRRVDGRVPADTAFYRPRLDEIWGRFGEDRLLYGSDWPNSDQWGTYEQGFRVVHEYFTSKGTAAAEKYFSKNSLAAYRWKQR
jgi:predicted TIM-barrel fold metal-dependent hydrolase